jgi:hypothetical protein
MPNSRTASLTAAAALLFTASAWAPAQSLIAAPAPAASLSFGQIVSGALPGSVRVSASGFRSTSGATYAASGFGVSAASFTIASAPNTPANNTGLSAWSVMLPVSATLSSGKAEMTVDGFEYSWGSAGAGFGQSSRTLTVGATLHVGARQPSSEYAGSFALTVAYN